MLHSVESRTLYGGRQNSRDMKGSYVFLVGATKEITVCLNPRFTGVVVKD